MMLSKFDCGNLDCNDGELSNGEFLHDIEEISNALYVDRKTHDSNLISSSNLRPSLGKKTQFCDSKSKSKMGLNDEDEWCRNGYRSTSIWGWKPLKALSHIRHKKFACYFFCHVHSVENLPSNFDGVCLSVHWKRKDDVLRTRSLRVSNGMINFKETLMSKCNVYGAKNGNGNFMKYEPKHFLLCVSVVGVEGFDVGKHWVDLTRLLPVRAEELEKDKCSGKWSTSFKLEGKARGATLHVSFGFLVTKDSLAELGGNIKLPLVLNLERNELNRTSFVADCVLNEGNTSLRRADSVPSSLTDGASSNSYQCFDVRFGWPKDISDFSNSISMLYGKLDDGGTDDPANVDLVYEHLESLKLSSNSLVESRNDIDGAKHDDGEFTAIEDRIESESTSEEATLLYDFTVEDLDDSTVEVINVAEIFKGDEISSDEDTMSSGKEVSDSLANDLLIDKHSILDIEELSELEPSTRKISGELEGNYVDKEGLLDMQESPKLESSEDLTSGEFKVNYIDKDGLLDIQERPKLELSEDLMSGEFKEKHKGSKLVRSLSLDDVAKAVVEDFCNLWQEGTPSTPSSNTTMESPRERLLRQFEEDMMASETFFLRDNILEEDYDSESGSDHAAQSISFADYSVDLDVDLSPIITNDMNQSVNQASRSKSQAKTLERLETQTLMESWGLNEDAFLSSPDYSAGGFGSPIFVPLELDDPVGLPPLGEGLESLLKLNNGGLLRSMNPLLFKNTKNCGSLIMQTSKLAVLPAELGFDIMELLQGMASVGSERLSKKLHSLLPLDKLSGKIMQLVAREASCEPETHTRPSSLHQESDVKIRIETPLHVPDYSSVSSRSPVNDTTQGYTTTGGLSALILDTIEALTVEGLKVQSGMSDENAPSNIRVKPAGEPTSQHTIDDCDQSSDLGVRGTVSYIESLLDLSISLDEWLQLDAGMFDNENDFSDQTLKLLRAHHARNIAGKEFVHHETGKCGVLGDNLTVGLMIQLRDPLRNYEPVGTPMLGLIQMEMERVLSSSESDEDDKTRVPTFRLKEVHIAGLNLESDHTESWATKKQRQSGSRWLLASGLIQKRDSHLPKSMSLVRFSTQVFKKPWTRSFLWSMSHTVQGIGINTQFSPWYVHTRNPDLKFL